MKAVKFKTPKGDHYILAKEIAENRADYYAVEKDGHEKGSKEYEEEVLFALNDDFECIDWLLNNSNFEDWKDYAVKMNDKVGVSEDDFWTSSDDFEMIDIEVSKGSMAKFGINSIIPEECPICFNKLKIIENFNSGAVGLYCVNQECAGTAVKKLQKAIEVLDIKGIGLSICEKLYLAGIKKIEDVFDKTKFNRMKLIESGEFKSGRSLDIIVDAVDDKTSLELKRVINSLNFEDVGSTMSESFARHLVGLDVDFSGFNKEAVARFVDPNSDERIRLKNFLSHLEDNQIDIIEPKEHSSDVYFFEMTGKPGRFGQKKDFIDLVSSHGYVHHKLDKDCKLLVTDSLDSSSGKMGKARKLGVEIKTYEQVAQDLGFN